MSNTNQLQQSPATLVFGACLAASTRVGQINGEGFVLAHVQRGKGGAFTEYAELALDNGHYVVQVTRFPSPFAHLLDRDADIREEYRVWFGWESTEDHLDTPPAALPAGAVRWVTRIDEDVAWYVGWDIADQAIAYAASLAAVGPDHRFPPIARG